MVQSQSFFAPDTLVWRQMEETLIEVRERWFGARVERLPVGALLQEREGDLLFWESAARDDVERWLAWARRRRIYLVQTSMSEPQDLGNRLTRSGYRQVQRQGTYLYNPQAPAVENPERHLSLLDWLRPRRMPATVQMQQIGLDALPIWNQVCWQAFAPRTVGEAASLTEKQRAFAGLGEAAYWFLAWVDGEPVGTIILYEGPVAGQILAVGTLSRVRRRGVASAMVRHVIAVHRERYVTPLFLDTQPGSGAEQLYLGLGFVPAYIRQTYAPLPIP